MSLVREPLHLILVLSLVVHSTFLRFRRYRPFIFQYLMQNGESPFFFVLFVLNELNGLTKFAQRERLPDGNGSRIFVSWGSTKKIIGGRPCFECFCEF